MDHQSFDLIKTNLHETRNSNFRLLWRILKSCHLLTRNRKENSAAEQKEVGQSPLLLWPKPQQPRLQWLTGWSENPCVSHEIAVISIRLQQPLSWRIGTTLALLTDFFVLMQTVKTHKVEQSKRELTGVGIYACWSPLGFFVEPVRFDGGKIPSLFATRSIGFVLDYSLSVFFSSILAIGGISGPFISRWSVTITKTMCNYISYLLFKKRMRPSLPSHLSNLVSLWNGIVMLQV